MDAVCLRLLVILVAIFPLTITDDACKFLNDDYCFRFGQMPCYQKICECEQKNCTDVTECVLSPWCDPSGKVLLTNETFSPINHDCNLLRKNCLNREKNNGYCFIYRGGCPKNEDVESKLEKSTSEKLLRRCQRWKRKCEQKYPKHYACKQLRRKCSALNITVTAGTNNDSLSSEEDRNEQLPKQKLDKMCTKWERKCAEKWPNHYSCRMLKKKCSFQNPIIQPITGLRAGNTTNSAESVNVNDRGKILEQCQKWKKTCAQKYPEHFSCRQYRRRCKFVDAQSRDIRTNSTVIVSSLFHTVDINPSNSTLRGKHQSDEDSDETSDLLNES